MGPACRKSAERKQKETVFISSGALSHHLVRGRNVCRHWPNRPSMHNFDLLNRQRSLSAQQMLPQYAKTPGLKPAAATLQCYWACWRTDVKHVYGYGQSSGSSNVVMAFEPAGQKLARTLSMKRYRALSCFHNTIRIVEGNMKIVQFIQRKSWRPANLTKCT
ncbi:hypothetical protein PO124_05180 [Bacillus licheniformis]|nr:hypothetical protein [Bacillus licheniformis]